MRNPNYPCACDMQLTVHSRVPLPLLIISAVLMSSCALINDEDSDFTVLGPWGGDHVLMVANAEGAELEYDCAYGAISEPILADETGSFAVIGTHTFEHGGPIKEGESTDIHPALFTGRITGSKMTLTVALTDTSVVVGTFTLNSGTASHVYKCL